ncbi:MAG: protein kinase [Myxococcaceae bacterium]|nr:protein kinase [Myxococcaceae bacterium]
MRCGDEQQLSAWASGWLDADESAAVREHLDGCASCRLLADAIVGADGDGALVLKPGARLEHYVIAEWLGSGAMADVFAAEDTRLGRAVALKVLRAEWKTQAAHMLQTEARAMAALSHPNVATVFDIGQVKQTPYLVMERLPGGTLRHWLASPRTESEVLRVFAALADGLHHAHRLGVLHRDFKPENVLFTDDGVPRITDFGLALLEEPRGTPAPAPQPARVAGTPAFLAPELLRGSPASAASDQYAFGRALQLALEPLAPGRAALDAVTRMLSSEPRARFEDLAAVASALRQADPVRRVARRRVALALSAVAVAAGLSWAGLRALEVRRCQRFAADASPRGSAPFPWLQREFELLGQRQTEQLERACRLGGVESPAAACLEVAAAVTSRTWADLGQPGLPAEDALDQFLALPVQQCELVPGSEQAPFQGAALARRRQLERALGGHWADPLALGAQASSLGDDDLAVRLEAGMRRLTLLERGDLSSCDEERAATLANLERDAQRAHAPGAQLFVTSRLAMCQRRQGERPRVLDTLQRGADAAALLGPRSLAALNFQLRRARLLATIERRAEAREVLLPLRAALPSTVGPGHPLSGSLLSTEAYVGTEPLDPVTSARLYGAALADLVPALGPDAREVRFARHNRASMLAERFAYVQALEELEQVSESQRRSEGALSPGVVSEQVPLFLAVGRIPDAVAAARALESEVPVDRLSTMVSAQQFLGAWAEGLLAAGEAAEVEQRLKAARAIEHVAPPDESAMAERRSQEARALAALGRPAEGLKLLDEVSERVARLGPTERQQVAWARVVALVALGRRDAAAAVASALPLDDSPGIDPARRAWLHLLAGVEPERARTFAATLGPRAAWALEAGRP